MPMSPRLLRPRSSGVHPEAADWRNRVIANGGTVSSATFKAVADFCRSIDATAGLRATLLRVNLFCGTGLEACLVPLYRGASRTSTQWGNSTDTNANFVSGDYTETGTSGGLAAGASNTTKRLSTGFDPVTAGLSHTDTHMAWYSRAVITANNCVIGSFGGGVPQATWQALTFGGLSQMYYRSGGGSNSGIEAATWSGANRSGFVQVQRNSSDAKCYRNGVDLNMTVTTTNANNWTSVSPGAVMVFARNNQGTADQIMSATLQGYSLGLSMTATQASAYYTAMQTFQTALGRQL